MSGVTSRAEILDTPPQKKKMSNGMIALWVIVAIIIVAIIAGLVYYFVYYNPKPTPPKSAWADLNRTKDEQLRPWSNRIYNAIIGQTEPADGGGVTLFTEILGTPTTLTTLTPEIATKLCVNPCFWYGTKKGEAPSNPNSKSTDATIKNVAKFCDCSPGKIVPINF